jgi:hypothetical protein
MSQERRFERTAGTSGLPLTPDVLWLALGDTKGQDET